MQTQQQNSAPRSRPRLSVGELVIALVNLALCGLSGYLGYDFLRDLKDIPNVGPPGLLVSGVALSTGLAGLLILARQRRLAVTALGLATLCLLGFAGLFLWIYLRLRSGHTPSPGELLGLLPLVAAALLTGGFAWFLKRMDNSA
jgi:hypothetical protein